ncbi:ABC transporter substrate-binding protein [Aquibacillus albus]|uniref:Multiple sugar transport system substrate-binding protein n=1 Tax=Aquibacillus albus TaxID=1168171 RepID=A0ABS2MYR4_9BACI|nr:extracellular solute-binding protein [Aquibacillus albus]MBM7571024.1 multiple sugar transport system substrate-binding protein [Aquibacillus albus]
MKKTLILLLGLFMTLWLAACSSDSSSGDSGDTSSGNGSSEVEEDNGSGEDQITIRFAWWGNQTRNNYTNEVIELFEEKNPNINVEAEYASWDDYWKKLAPQAAANELPDIIQMDLSYISQYAQNNQLADLTPYLDNEIDVSNIDQNIINGGKIGDGLYGFNAGVNAVGFHYDPAMLEAIGVDSISEDWTWDDYIEIADQAAGAGYYFDTGFQPDVFFNYYLRTQGDRLYAEDGSGLGYEDDQLFVDFFSMVADRVEAGSTPTPDYLSQLSGVEDDPVVKEEGVGIWQWSNQFLGLQQVADRPLEMHPMPGPNVSDGLFLKPSMFLAVSENSDHKEAAASFIDFFVNDVEANKIIKAERGVPVSSEIKEEIASEVSEAQQQVFEYIDWAEQNSSEMGPPDPSGAGEIIELLNNLSEQMNYGEISPEDAATNFRQQAESILAN